MQWNSLKAAYFTTVKKIPLLCCLLLPNLGTAVRTLICLHISPSKLIVFRRPFFGTERRRSAIPPPPPRCDESVFIRFWINFFVLREIDYPISKHRPRWWLLATWRDVKITFSDFRFFASIWEKLRNYYYDCYSLDNSCWANRDNGKPSRSCITFANKLGGKRERNKNSYYKWAPVTLPNKRWPNFQVFLTHAPSFGDGSN